MSSQEDYLDQLLKNMNRPTEEEESAESEIVFEQDHGSEQAMKPESVAELNYDPEPEQAMEPAELNFDPEETVEPEPVTELNYDPEPEQAMEPETVAELNFDPEPGEIVEPETVAEPNYDPEPGETVEPEPATALNYDPEPELTMEPEPVSEANLEPEDTEMDDIRALIQEAEQAASEEEESDIMSEEDIEKLLNQNKADAKQETAGMSVDEDLMSILDESSAGDEDLEDIHSLLQKAENNIAVDESLAAGQDDVPDALAALNAVLDGENPDGAEDEFAGLSEKEKKAILKKREKEEKAARKKAEKEAKKAEKEAKRAERRAKKQKSRNGAGEDTVSGDENIPDTEIGAETSLSDSDVHANIPIQGDEPIAMDMSDLDAILGVSEPQNNEPETSASSEPDSIEETVREFQEEMEGEIALDEAELDAKLKEAEDGKKKKKGLIARIIEFLTEDDEEEENTAGGTEDVPLSDENKNILEEMDQEEKGKKGKKAKKPKKDKKAKNAPSDDEEGDEEGGSKDKGKKAKKAPKPKKEKVKEPTDPKDKIPIKRLLPIIAACASLLLVLILLISLGGDFTVKQEAKKAYYQEDYETCYQVLYGKKLNESEQVMFGKSESILRIRLWMREYEIFAGEGSETEALDVLIQAVNDYSDLYEYARQWNADGDISVIYSQILDILQQKYHLTESQALEIAAEPDDVEYTRKVMTAAKGLGYAETPEGTLTELPDMLPEEKQFPENYGGR